MSELKRLLLVVLLLFAGTLLILAGINLIELSKDLLLYLGLGLLILAVSYFFVLKDRQKGGE